MRTTLLLVVGLAVLQLPSVGKAQEDLAADFDPQEFLARYADGVRPLDRLYAEMAEGSLPLRDERGQFLTRRHIEDREQALNQLRTTVHELALAPEDLVLAVRLFVQGESLADDLFDLSQVAYDNDREELAKGFSDLLSVMDQHNSLLESYVLKLAAGKQERLHALEKENNDLRQRLKEVQEHPHSEASRPR